MKNLSLLTVTGFVFALYAAPAVAFGTTADAIYSAAKSGQSQKINALLNRGHSIDATDNFGSTALCKAAADGNMRAYNLLISYGANPNAKCMYKSGKNSAISSKYLWGGAIAVGAGVAIAAAAGGGGGGGGGGNSSATTGGSTNSGTNSNDNDNENITEGTWTTGGGEENPVDNNTGGNGYNNDGGTWTTGGDNGGTWSTGGGDNEGGDNGGTWSTGGGDNEGGDNGGTWSTGGGDNEGGQGSGNEGGQGNDNEGGQGSGNEGGNEGGQGSGNEGGQGSGNEGGDTPTTQEQAISYFNANREYNGSNFGGNGLNSVNYMNAINAATAYAQFSDETGNFTTALAPVTVGMVDTGVWANHSEFMQNGVSKVSGYNYDYGPCRNGDYKNCWRKVKILTRTKLVFSHSFLSGDVYNSNMSDQDIAEFDKWASFYPDDYDWDNLDKTDVSPNQYKVNGQTNSTNMHGTHVAALIAGNKDDKGMMGIAYDNASIKAVRWDYQSTIEDPIKYLISDDNVKIINLSMSISATNNDYNANTITNVNDINSGFVNAMRAVMAKNNDIVVVKAAGNENSDHPDAQSGIKKFAEFDNLKMLVVTSVDVNFDANGKVTDYQLSSFANKCGITGQSGYCLAAPGGNTADGANVIYSAGQPDVNGGYYAAVGTSQATPIVSGSLAFLMGAYPYMSSQQIIELVLTTTNKSAADYSADKYGAGLLDLGKAVTTYIAHNNSLNLATFSGNSVNGSLVGLDNASLNVPSSLSNALQKALPAGITVFDRYNRPFAISTNRFVHTTHGSYQSLKTDVEQIAISPRMTIQKDGNLSFMFAPSSLKAQNTVGAGLIAAEYKNGKHRSGFYFSENTAYKTVNNSARELNNPFMTFTNAYGFSHDYDFSKNTALRLEAVTGRNGLYDGARDFNDHNFYKQAYAVNMAMDIHKKEKYALTLSSGLLYEDKALLGLNGDGAFALNGANTYTAGISATYKPLKRLTLSSSYYHGWTTPQKFASNIIRTSKLESSSFAFVADYQKDNTTHFGLRLSSPLRIEKGRLKVDVATGRDNYSDTIYRQTYTASLKPKKREYKLMAYWHKDISENISLRTETGVRINPEHQSKANDYIALFGLSWNFN